MGLGKFVAARIYQIPAQKSYLSAHQSRFDQDEPTTCPRCSQHEETFKHAILEYPACARNRDLLLNEVSSIDHSSLLGSDSALLQALSQYILTTQTVAPPKMLPSFSPPPSSNASSP